MIEQKQILKFLRTFFSTPTEIDGVVYNFVEIDIEKNFDNAFKFLVDVILPDPNQSYIAQVFNDILTKLIYDSFNFIGQTYSYSLEMTINGQELFPNTYAYIKQESLDRIINRFNEQYKKIGFDVDLSDGEKTLNMNCKLSWDNFPYDGSGDNLDFYLKVKLSNFFFDENQVIPNPKKEDLVAGTLWSILADRDWFTPRMEEIIYSEISADTKINEVEDVYVQVFFRVVDLNGKDVDQIETYSSLQSDDFIEVS
jgi:hypothetical protein